MLSRCVKNTTQEAEREVQSLPHSFTFMYLGNHCMQLACLSDVAFQKVVTSFERSTVILICEICVFEVHRSF